jgi:hypothetical protein
MVSGDQIQQLLNDPLQYAVDYRYVLMCVAGLAAAAWAIAVGTAGKSKTKKRQLVLSPYFPEPAVEAPRQPLIEEAPRPAVEPYLEPGARVPALPLPQAQDLDYARKTLVLSEVSSMQGWQLYFDGAKQNDLHMAMTGLRFYTRFILEGGYRNYTSPWREYKDLADSYLSLARAHNSGPCLELARDAFTACDMTIYPEPSTERVSREVLQNLQLLNHELAVRPGA